MRRIFGDTTTKADKVSVDVEDLIQSPELRARYEDVTSARDAGRLIRKLRQMADLSQETLASRLAVTQARISALETGTGRDGPSYAMVQRIAGACGFTWPSHLEMADFLLHQHQSANEASPNDAGLTEVETGLSWR